MDIAFLNIAMYISVNLLLFSSWYILLYKKKNYLSFADRLIGAFVLGLTQIIATEMLLGVVFKKLFAVPLFLSNIFISSSILIFVLLQEKMGTKIYPAGKNISNRVSHEIKDETVRIFGIIKRDRILFCIFCLFITVFFWLIFLAYLFPSYGWDALWYHLPIVGNILQRGAIEEEAVSFSINLFINIFPKNIELFFLWNTIFLNSDIIMDMSQLFFTITGVLTIYSIAVKLKIKEEYAIYSSLLFFFTPVIILQSTMNYVDIAVSVLFLIAINFLMRDDREKRTTPVLLSGLATGILLGSKGSGPIFLIVLSAAILIHELTGYFNLVKPRSNLSSNIPDKKCRNGFVKDSLITYMVNFMPAVLLLGGYWYIKNWMLYGNPVYPMEVSFFNITLFKGLYGGIIDSAPGILDKLPWLQGLFYVWLERVEYYLYDSGLSGFGPMWFILYLPSLVFSIVYAIKWKRYNFLFIGAILIVTFLLYPRNWNTRYVIFIVGLGALSFGLVLENFNRRAGILKVIALLIAGYVFFSANSPSIMPGKIREFILLSPGERTVARLAPFNIDLHARQEYGYWIWISDNISERDTLAFTFEPLFLAPLWNREFSNRIVYIRSDAYNVWTNELKMNNVTHVLIRTNSMEDGWIKKEKRLLSGLWWVTAIKEKFKVVYADENYKIMRFGQ
ncbi:hypothetical protein BMS3Abin10_01747 [bacterium BMS3Abin10]|nr:hypothetical protein BMS3Abin10_01747 [bacterium BMS3Abin10]GBE39108.1 hypothetical protein BMS3Bbin08_01726 [bacterium BMS3Bbin08]